MTFSIIIPSYLGDYPGAAKDRENKFRRCLRSLISQTYEDWEGIIIADGCKRTIEICKEPEFMGWFEVFCILKTKEHFGGSPRNSGLQKATGDWILYLDTDDYFGKDHLHSIAGQLNNLPTWYWFNDITHVQKDGKWTPKERECSIFKKGYCGTSNIIHKSTLPVSWGSGYLHDWDFIEQLKKFPYSKINTPQYYVCHIPKLYDL